MKKVLILLLLVLALTGCTINKIGTDNLDKVVDTILKNNDNLVNTVARGYKYYLPTGVSLINSSSYNEKLYYNGNYYYLYVDIVSYYNKVKNDYVVNKDAYYSRKLEFEDKTGYIEINKINDSYFLEAMYNYAKIEAYVSEQNISKTLINISYLLTSIKFNNSVTELLLGGDDLTLGEEKFSIFKPKRKEGTFLDYIEEYDKYEDEVIVNEENTESELGKENE